MCVCITEGEAKQRKGKKKASTEEGEIDKEKLEYHTNAYQSSDAGELTIMLCPVHTWYL